MGNRLSRVYTRTGDAGTTGLGDGRRVPKESARIEAIGSVDELNCVIGILAALELPETIRGILLEIQQRLFDLGGELSVPGLQLLPEGATLALEQRLDALNRELPPLREFILPGGSLPAASCHHARAVCRRAERRVLALRHQPDEEVGQEALRFLNRLSDLLFVIARTLARLDGGDETMWDHKR
ncbi:MAG TPA: cob(I)yrinic acid a,c-diamide adenosyltransferase [Sedimenticola sp.]|nr:cob(I)yrinic acid a,c-diamide adenosyltransferase [Sedimenticola sp.]